MDQPTPTVPKGSSSGAAATGRLRKFFGASIRLEASDIILRPGNKVKFRLRGSLRDADAPPFTDAELEEELKDILRPDQYQTFLSTGMVDLAWSYDADNRFRLNVFRTMGRPAIAARRVSSKIKSFDELYLPPVMKTIAEHHQGLVLLCGITGSGKSTTIAAMLQQVNETRPCHILTIEDPIEFLFKDAKAIVNQREIGVDVPNFDEALRGLVRENPDVVLIGELRDKETFRAAVHAAETGHLVFGTVHASSASQCFNRIYNLFEPEERELIREMFSSTMRAIVYQKLLKTMMPDVARVPAVEVLLNTPAVAKYILDGKENELPDVIKNSRNEGMIDYTGCLVDLVNKQYIHPKTALEAARSADELKMRLKGIVTGTG